MLIRVENGNNGTVEVEQPGVNKVENGNNGTVEVEQGC